MFVKSCSISRKIMLLPSMYLLWSQKDFWVNMHRFALWELLLGMSQLNTTERWFECGDSVLCATEKLSLCFSPTPCLWALWIWQCFVEGQTWLPWQPCSSAPLTKIPLGQRGEQCYSIEWGSCWLEERKGAAWENSTLFSVNSRWGYQ